MRVNNLKEILGAERSNIEWWRDLPESVIVENLLPNLASILYKARAAGRDLIQYTTLDPESQRAIVTSPLVYANAAAYMERIPVLDLVAYRNYLRMVVTTNLEGIELPAEMVLRAIKDQEFGYYVDLAYVSDDEVHVGVVMPKATSHFRASSATEQQLKRRLAELYIYDDNGRALRLRSGAMAELGLAYYVWPGVDGSRTLEALRTDYQKMNLIISRSQLPL